MTERLECGCRYQSDDSGPPWRLVELCAQHAISRMLRITGRRRKEAR